MTKKEILQNMYALADKAVKGGTLTIQEAAAVNATLLELESKIQEDVNEVETIKSIEK